MKHRMKFTANPRLLVIPLVMLLLIAAGILLYFYLNVIVGVLVTGVALFLDYRLGKLLWSMLMSGIETLPEGAEISIRGGKKFFLKKTEITVAGFYHDDGRPAVFLYAEATDQFFACADIFTNFTELEDWLRANAPFEDHQDLDMAGVKTLLKDRYGDQPENLASENRE